MQNSWLGIILMALVVIIGLIVSLVLSKDKIQKRASGAAFASLALMLVLFCVSVIVFSQRWMLPFFVVACIVVPIAVYAIVVMSLSRMTDAETKNNKHDIGETLSRVSSTNNNRSKPSTVKKGAAVFSASDTVRPLVQQAKPASVPSRKFGKTAVPAIENVLTDIEMTHEYDTKMLSQERASEEYPEERQEVATNMRQKIAQSMQQVEQAGSRQDVLKADIKDIRKESGESAAFAPEKIEDLKKAQKYDAEPRTSEAKVVSDQKAVEEQKRFETEKRAAELRAVEEQKRRTAEQKAAAERERRAAELRSAEERERQAAAERRAAEERRRIEAERKAVQERERLEAEKKAAEQKAAAERKRLEAEKKAAEQKAAAERKRLEAEMQAAAERQRLAAQQREAEEARRAAIAEKQAAEAASASKVKVDSSKVSEVAPAQVKDEPSFETFFEKADKLKAKGVYPVAARLYTESIQYSADKEEKRKASYEAMICYVKADMLGDAQVLASTLNEQYSEHSTVERMKIDAVLRSA